MYTIRSRWLVAAFAVALLPACGKKDPNATSANASATPAKTVLVTVQLVRQGRLDDLFKHVLPPAEYRHMRAEWQAQHAKARQISEQDRKRFAEGMAQLTAPDANQQIWARIEPRLAKMDQQTKARLPLMIGMGQLALDTQIGNSEQLTPDQKKQATGVVDAVGAWAQKVDWTDADHIKQAIGVVTSSARKLDVKTLDQAVGLNYDQAMQKYSVVWNGLKQVLDVYGLSLDKTLDSATAKTLDSDSHTATVRVDYTLLGKPQHVTVDLVKIDDRWYDKELLDHWRHAIGEDQPAATASQAAAPAAPPAGAKAGAKAS